jgi:hypothetical protein
VLEEIMKLFLSQEELSAYLTEIGMPMAESTLENKRVSGGGPPFVKQCGVRYRLSDVEKWLNSMPAFKSTSERSTSK